MTPTVQVTFGDTTLTLSLEQWQQWKGPVARVRFGYQSRLVGDAGKVSASHTPLSPYSRHLLTLNQNILKLKHTK